MLDSKPWETDDVVKTGEKVDFVQTLALFPFKAWGTT